MIAIDIAYGVSLLCAGLSLLGVALLMRNQKGFNKCMKRCRDRQVAFMEALKNGDVQKADLFLAAAQEELDRAEMYL